MWPLLLACAPPPPNILLVSLDTVRWDHTSLGGERDTTPALAALARRGVSWRAAWAVGNESLYSHAALLTGLYPSEVAVPDYASYALPASATTLAGVLGAYGYDTAAFTGGGHIVADFGFDNGFSSFTASGDDMSFGSLFDSVPAALAWIDDREGPWFAFVHGYDAHAPYVRRGPFSHAWGTGGGARIEAIVADQEALEQLRGPLWFVSRRPTDFVHAAGRKVLGTDFYRLPATPAPGEPVVRLTDGEIRHLRDHYDNGVSYGDLWLGVLLSRIDLERTLVLVVSDHGEDLLDHGFVNHRAGLWDSTLHVPLVVAGPGFTGGEVRDDAVDLRSVLPTALRAAGAVVPAAVRAAPLQDRPSHEVLFAEGVMDMLSAWDAHTRLVLHDVGLAEGGTGSLADATVYVDGVEVAAPTARAEALFAEVQAWRASVVPATTTGAQVSPRVKAALRKQGYWEPSRPEPR